MMIAILQTLSLGGASCHLHAEEPRQRQDFADPPVQYGDTRFSGMALPVPNQDAGTAAH
jgi:hypothetical protein